ncbi:MAG: aminotransferase class IV [Deltaproteobacteria bacterium]|nr:MAG: aminotransferase class IV [Deltaproteobacteria bacterium]
MKMNYVWINGQIIPAKQALISINNSSFLNGIGVFETMKGVNGNVLFLPLHLKRFFNNAKKAGLKLSYSPTLLSQEITRILRHNVLPIATIRMTLSKDEEGKPHLVIAPKPFEPYPKENYTKGGKLVFIKTVMADTATLSPIKTTSYLTKMLAREEAKKRGAVEGLLINAKGCVTEGASSNIFIVKNGILFTPPLSDGLLPGTRRKVVLEIAQKLKIQTKEKCLTPKDILGADEIFITSSLKDILPIRKIEKRNLKTPGAVSQKVQNHYLMQL